MDDESDEGDHHASGFGHAGQNREESHGLYHARAPSQPGKNGGASSSGDHAGQSREESHELNHAQASSQPGKNGEALPDDDPSEASRPLRTSDAAAHHHALLVLNPPDSDESEDSELTPEELIEAIVESTCISTLDHWGPEAIDLMVSDPAFTVLRNAKHNALLMWSDGTHGVFLRAEVDEAYERIGRQCYQRPDPAALPARRSQRFRSVSSSVTMRPLPTPPPDYPLVPRAPWMLEGDPRSDAEADAD
jgi:hypothetical protein